MPKTIDLARAARSADSATFRTTVRAGNSGTIGADGFTASGGGKDPRSVIGAGGFTASGGGKRTTRLGAEGFTASGVGKEEE